MSQSQSSQVQALHEYIDALERQAKSVEQQRQSLMQQLKKSEEMQSKTDGECRQMRRQFQQLNSVMYRQAVEKSNLQSRMKFFMQENEKLKKQNQYKEQKIQQLNNAVREKSDLLAKEKNSVYLTSQYNAKQLSDADNKIKLLEGKMANAESDKVLLSKEIDNKQVELKGQRESNKQLRKEIALTKQQLFKKVQQITSLSQQLTKSSQKLATRTAQAQQRQQQLTKIRQQSQRLRQEIKIQMQSIQGLNVSLKLQTSNFQKEFEINKRLNGEIKELGGRFEELERKLGGKERESSEWMGRYQQLRGEYEQLIRQHDGLATTSSTQNQELASINSHLNQKNQLLTNRINQLFTQLTQSKDENRQLNDILGKMRKQLDGINGQLLVERMQSNKLSGVNEQVGNQLFTLNEQLKQLKQQHLIKTQHLQSKLHTQRQQLSRLNNQLSYKLQLIKSLTEQSKFSSKQYSHKQQQFNKKYLQLQAKCNRQKQKLGQLQQQISQLTIEHNTQVNKLILQHKHEIKVSNHKHQQEVRTLKSMIQQVRTQLVQKIDKKQQLIQQLLKQIDQLKLANITQIQTKQSALKLQLQLIKDQLRQKELLIESLQNKLINTQSQLQSIKQIHTANSIKLQITTVQLEKYKKDNLWLTNQSAVLTQQVEALQNTTTYLKKQISSALQNNQSSLKEIRFLKQAKRENATKLVSIKYLSDINTARDRTNNGNQSKRTKTFFQPNKSNINLYQSTFEHNRSSSSIIEDFSKQQQFVQSVDSLEEQMMPTSYDNPNHIGTTNTERQE